MQVKNKTAPLGAALKNMKKIINLERQVNNIIITYFV